MLVPNGVRYRGLQLLLVLCDFPTFSADITGTGHSVVENLDCPELGEAWVEEWREILADVGSVMLLKWRGI